MTPCLVCGEHDARTALGGLRCNDCDGLSLAAVVGHQLFALDASPTPPEPSSVLLGDASSAFHRQATSHASRSVQPTDDDTQGANGAPSVVSTRSTRNVLVLVDGLGKAYWRTDYLEEGE